MDHTRRQLSGVWEGRVARVTSRNCFIISKSSVILVNSKLRHVNRLVRLSAYK